MKLIILDRDGVINVDREHGIQSPEEWHPIDGSLEAIATLHGAGYTIAIATNQAGIAKGLYTQDTLQAVHAKLHRFVEAAGGKMTTIHHCPHDPNEGCPCRKPKPGLLHAIATSLKANLENVPMIGDRLKDIEAARAAGCRPILLRTGFGEQTLAEHPTLDVPVYDDLSCAVDALLADSPDHAT